MSEIGVLGLGPINIGEAANPPFAVLPNPAVLFHDRLARLEGSVVGWPGAHKLRFCSCALCGTMGHIVRVKCTPRGSTETCDSYRSHVKILCQVGDPTIAPPADDVATLGLDMRMGKAGWERGGYSPFLQGYEAT